MVSISQGAFWLYYALTPTTSFTDVTILTTLTDLTTLKVLIILTVLTPLIGLTLSGFRINFGIAKFVNDPWRPKTGFRKVEIS